MVASQPREWFEKELCATLQFLLDVVLLQDLKGVGERGGSTEGFRGVQIRQRELSNRVDRIVGANKRCLLEHVLLLTSVAS